MEKIVKLLETEPRQLDLYDEKISGQDNHYAEKMEIAFKTGISVEMKM